MKLTATLLALAFAACERHERHEAKTRDDSSDERAPKQQAAATRPSHVQLSAEAIQRAGIRVAPVELRALSGGAAIPAEVQLEPSAVARVRSLAVGRITQIFVTLGQRVRRGQMLGVVSSADVSSVRSQFESARARLETAELTLHRQQLLAKEGIGAQRSLNDAQATVSELRAEVEGARRQLSVLGSGTAGDLSLASPIDGVIAAIDGSLGETTAADTTVFTVIDQERVWVRADVPELELNRPQLGAAAVVRLYAYPDVALSAKVTYIAPAIEERTRTLPVRLALAAPDPRIRGGMFAAVEFLGNDADGRVPAVPIDAVTILDGQDVVFVPTDAENTFRPVPVTLGRRAAGLVELRDGVKPGESAAVSGVFTIKSALCSDQIGDDNAD